MNIKDPNTYLWEIKVKNKIPFSTLFPLFLMFLFIPILYFGLFKLIELISIPLAKGIAVFFFIGIVAMILLFTSTLFLAKKEPGSDKIGNQIGNLIDLDSTSQFWETTKKTMFLFLAGVVLYGLSTNIFSISEAFTGNKENSFQWILYYLDSLLRVISFDIIDIYNIKFSTISATAESGLLAKTLLNFAIGAGALQLGYNIIKSNETVVFHGTASECYNKLDAYSQRMTHFMSDYKISIIGYFNKDNTQKTYDMVELYKHLEEQKKLN